MNGQRSRSLPSKLLPCAVLLAVFGVFDAGAQGFGGAWCLHEGPWQGWDDEGEDGEACDLVDWCVDDLSGDAVVPPVVTDAEGRLDFEYILGCGAHWMSVNHTVEDAIAVEVRLGGPGENGPLFISRPVNPEGTSTTIGSEAFCPAPPGPYYVVVTSAAHPAGEVRAQLCLGSSYGSFGDLYCPNANPALYGPPAYNEVVPGPPVTVASLSPCGEVRERPLLQRKRESLPWLEGGPWLAGWLGEGLHLARSLDDGASWGAAETVAAPVGGAVTAPTVALGVAEDRLLDFGIVPDAACGEGECPPSGGTLFSTDAGATWSDGAPLRIPEAVGPTRAFHECFDRWTAFGTRADSGVFVATSADNGATWEEEQVIDTSAWGTAPLLHDVNSNLKGGWIAIVQVTRDNAKGVPVDVLVALHSEDNRASWSGDELYEHGVSLGHELPRAAVATNERSRWVAVWGVRHPGSPEVHELLASRFMDNHPVWSAPVKIADDAPAFPAFATNYQRAWLVVWSGSGGETGLFDDLFYSVSVNFGETWTSPRRMLGGTSIDRARLAPALHIDGPAQGMVAWLERAGPGCDTAVRSMRFGLAVNGDTGGEEAPEADLGALAALLLNAFGELDEGGAGSLPWSALSAWFGALASGADGPAALFAAFDANGDGALSVSELRAAAGAGSPVHAADGNADGRVSLSELLRVIQFYNSGGYRCAENAGATEDGYRPGAGDTDCHPHSSDYAPQDWSIGLSELLRLIQVFNSAGYTHCPSELTEDGFCLQFDE